ncbi:MAG: 1-(5-phosphoribosyl)-5-amino-4-imidazole-carboxylate carboxylase [Candidatus Schekmanbacteria bacterium RIFCSPHIGHO2_02_FULL_38_11]|uniref:1-(5-phosphoribosyl)-5-amino-4-imidazole-carboxylate carboxylase n=1 Tax=Candidatus Schekmanbacteria bacterium RIFCSPLOWO2_12_FULL_38_15 TaxID=1817883 RepID=A0A1F7SIZ0_9BACT|nr:MAG: 1-(5-phosphoribosyl)-5-amino-4-imidazole-carboxylate carboxylase [Candidatus Schekmanbacteria bacterium GWA2_38_9]OGL47921.1 MAG: 1-(5-phosphoribosyl)-5-amino-4-imidazole-carboxylate carboxylase [Candidatus Schekmanbacteria bacterium RIFCSPHIGHO2_02_FULL_38_11]OGL49287.1 MAG: 1-(5-phosphoribosyl)-5-amino-4-imidazole-carboxylate carboxylase [Candidatus Schekmanbacteria bacterium RIFCSPLOWO2_02_FULL_38_14]OGL53742.1 MAG: 1-(5-phosphoribosyl)-5-amino-4-imidazole-carboxylate carboxylase [Can
MNTGNLKNILKDVKSGKTTIDKAIKELKFLSFENLHFARVDHHRSLRKGFPEVIFCQGKTPEQIEKISKSILSRGQDLLATRANDEAYQAILLVSKDAIYNQTGRTVVVRRQKKKPTKGLVLVVSAGTSDIPVAEEAYVTAETLGSRVEKLYDVGVAGIHRLLAETKKLFEARVLVVVAGMEGALASVIGGIVDKPIIGVPTSIGYGASFNGISALLTMLNSCSSGIATVNIDNGFGAGYIAHSINILGETTQR